MVLEMTLSVQVSSCPYAACGPVCGVSRTSLDSRTHLPAVCTWGQVGSCEQRKSCSWDGPHVIVHYVSPGQS